MWEERKGGEEGEGKGEGGLGHMIVVALPSFVILNFLVGFWVKQPSLIWLAIKSRVLSSASIVRCDTTVRVMPNWAMSATVRALLCLNFKKASIDTNYIMVTINWSQNFVSCNSACTYTNDQQNQMTAWIGVHSILLPVIITPVLKLLCCPGYRGVKILPVCDSYMYHGSV